MGQTTSQIEAHIQDTREDLVSNLDELERKVKSVTDWKQHFRSNPMMMVSVAFGGGVLLATMFGGRKSRRGWSSDANRSEPRLATNRQKLKALETLDNIKGALVGVAASRFTNFVGDVIPGFHEQLQRTEEAAKTQHA